jgi:predicted nucleic acid-binding protein
MTMTGVRWLFVDTNILIYATDTLSQLQAVAASALQHAFSSGTSLVISPQIMREYLSAATRKGVTQGHPALVDILASVRTFRRDFTIVEDTPLVLDHLLQLLQTFPTAGKQVHDANIVATMQAHNIQHLLTHNVTDFNRFAGLITIVPLLATP